MMIHSSYEKQVNTPVIIDRRTITQGTKYTQMDKNLFNYRNLLKKIWATSLDLKSEGKRQPRKNSQSSVTERFI